MQIIFQDPLASLNPRMTVGQIISEPLTVFNPNLSGAVKDRVRQMMAKVGLLPNQINRYPHEFSGGQAQRIGIARAVDVVPRMIVCDEPVSALDVSIQAQIVNLLMDLQHEMGMSLIFISHNLSVVRHISHRIMVLYLGKVMEIADRESIYANPLHPYTQALEFGGADSRSRSGEAEGSHRAQGRPALAAQSAVGLPVPHPLPRATEICAQIMPDLLPASSTRTVACPARDRGSLARQEVRRHQHAVSPAAGVDPRHERSLAVLELLVGPDIGRAVDRRPGFFGHPRVTRNRMEPDPGQSTRTSAGSNHAVNARAPGCRRRGSGNPTDAAHVLEQQMGQKPRHVERVKRTAGGHPAAAPALPVFEGGAHSRGVQLRHSNELDAVKAAHD